MIGGLDLKNGPWIAGGCARRLWYGLPWKSHDVDLFFPNQSAFNAVCSKLDNQVFRSSEHLLELKTNVELKTNDNPYVTQLARTYQIQIGRVCPNMVKLQAVRKNWYGSMDEIFNGFDITVCKFATDGKTLVATQDAISDCDANVMRSNRELDRAISVNRIIKYSAYGFEPTRDIMANLLESYRNGSLFEEMQNDEY